jgi:hypothetical protein
MRNAQQEKEPERADDSGATDPGSAAYRSRPSYPEMMNRVRRLEQEVLERIYEIRPPQYELKTSISVMGPLGSEPLPVNAILVSQIDQLPDIIIEIKYSSRPLSKNIRNRIADAVYRLTSFRARVQTRAVVWLIVLFDGELDSSELTHLERHAVEFRGELSLSIVPVEAISDLTVPPRIISP